MRIGLIQITQESNTFTPGVTTIEAFEQDVLTEGRAVLDGNPGNWLTGALDQLATWPARSDLEVVPIIRAAAVPGPALEDSTLETLVSRTSAQLRTVGRLDGIVLILHGACITTAGRSADAAIAAAVRKAVGADTPVVAGLDHHAYLTEGLLASVDALVGHRTQPHDPADTGWLAANLLQEIIVEHRRPVMVWHRLPMVTHQEQYVTSGGPMGRWFARAREWEESPGMLSVSLFPMQPWLDVTKGGWSVLAVGRDVHTARSAADDLADAGWSQREQFMQRGSHEVAEAVRRACASSSLALISDLGDSVFGGALGNSTVLLRSLLAADLPGPALVPCRDPQAVAKIAQVPIGSGVSLTVGHDTSPGGPLDVSGTVVGRADLVLDLPGYAHDHADYGRCVLLHAGNVHLLVTERRGVSGNHPAVYEELGVNVADANMAVVKTAANIGAYAAYHPSHVQADTPGPTQSDVFTLPWRRITRPIFPLDETTDRAWRPDPVEA